MTLFHLIYFADIQISVTKFGQACTFLSPYQQQFQIHTIINNQQATQNINQNSKQQKIIEIFKYVCRSVTSNILVIPNTKFKKKELLYIYMLYILIIIISLFILWKLFFTGIYIYWRAVRALGYNHVKLFYHPLMDQNQYYLFHAEKHGDSFFQFVNYIQKYPETKVIILHSLPYPLVYLLDPEYIKKLAMRHTNYDMNKMKYVAFDNQLFKGLATSEGQQWKQMRKNISSVFSFNSLKKRETIINEVLQKNIHSYANVENLNLYSMGLNFTGQIAVKSFLGESFSSVTFNQIDLFHYLQKIIEDIARISMSTLYFVRYCVFGPLTMSSPLSTGQEKQIIQSIIIYKNKFKEILTQQYNQFKNGQKAVTPYLESFFKRDYYDNMFDDIIQQFTSLFLASLDSSDTYITGLYNLGEDQQFQQRLRKQVLNCEDINNCTLLNNFINQTLRLNGPVRLTLTSRVVNQFQLDGFKLKKGDFVYGGLGINMMNPKYFENPYKFNPDRFNTQLSNSYIFLPFYSGQRNCIGYHMSLMQIRMFIKKFLQHYKIERTQTKLRMIAKIINYTPLQWNLVKLVPLKAM